MINAGEAGGQEATYRQLVEAAVDYAIYLIDPAGRIATWNPGARRIKGYTAEEVIGQPFSIFFTEEDRHRGFPDAALETARREGRFESEGWRVRKDGSRFWAMAVIDAVRDTAGRVIGFAKITRDMTERHAAQQILMESERRFRLLVQGVTDYAIIMLDRGGRVANWNTGARRIKGYEAEEIIGQHFSRFYTAEDKAAGIPDRARAEAEATGRFEIEGWRLRKDGSRFWASVIIDAIWDEDGALIGFAKVTRDLTERRRADQALLESERQFRLLVQGVTDYAIFMLDPDGRVASWNEGARRIKGYEADEIIGQHFSRFYTEEDKASGVPQRVLAKARANGRFEAESWRVRKDGSRFRASVVIDAIRDDAGNLIGFAKVTRDVTERWEAQQALEETRAQLIQSQKLEALGQLTGGVAHDFNNILQVISAGITLAEKLPPGSARLGQILSEMRNATMRGTSLTRQLLAFSRRAPLRPEIMDTAKGMEEAVGLFSRMLGADISLDVQVDEDVWPVQVDVPQFEVALLNLAVNARDAMPNGGTLRVTASNLTLDGEPDGLSGPFVAIGVRDTGVGIPEEVLGRILEPFFTTKPIGKGTGLGLSQVHGFAQQAGGSVRVASKVNEGTEVTLLLPAAPEGGAARRQHNPDQGESPAIGPPEGMRILVVDDDPAVGRLTAGMLEGAGHQAVTVADPESALQHLSAGEQFDLVLSDVIMPGGMDGMDFVREVKRRWANLPVLLVTGYAGDINAIQRHFPVLHKPFTAVELMLAMKALLQQTSSARHPRS